MYSASSVTNLEVSAAKHAFIENKSLTYKTRLGELDIRIPA